MPIPSSQFTFPTVGNRPPGKRKKKKKEDKRKDKIIINKNSSRGVDVCKLFEEIGFSFSFFVYISFIIRISKQKSIFHPFFIISWGLRMKFSLSTRVHRCHYFQDLISYTLYIYIDNFTPPKLVVFVNSFRPS